MKLYFVSATIMGVCLTLAVAGPASGHPPKGGNSSSSSSSAKGVGGGSNALKPFNVNNQSSQSKGSQLNAALKTTLLATAGGKFNGKALPYGQKFLGKNGKNYIYQPCPQHLMHCCKPCHYCNWIYYCWFPDYLCYGYYCPQACVWYFWYEPFCCYLPCTYIVEYVPVQVAVQVSQTTSASSEDGGSATMPALPPGATAVPK
jgi:hypothetical protein